MEFLETKDMPPVIRGPIVESPRRLKALGVSLERPLTYVFAPPGYGKTTLCASFCNSLPAGKYKVVWLNLDESDRRLESFAFDLLSALDRALPDLSLMAQLGDRVGDFLQPDTQYDVQIALANALSRCKKRPYIVLDNYDFASPAADGLVRFLARAVPGNLSIVLSSSVPLSMDIADLLISGDLVEIHATDLLMTEEETEFFLEEHCGLAFSEEQVHEVCDLSRGCVSSLKIIASCLAETGNNNGGFAPALERAKARLQSYMLSRLLRMFDEETIRFLMKVSFAPRFTVGLCHAAGLGNVEWETLNNLVLCGVLEEEKSGYGSWYSIAPIYRNTVLTMRDQHLSKEEWSDVCDALIKWYEDEEMFEEALELMIVQKNDGRFISLFTRNMDTLLKRNDGTRILEWLGGMSESAATSNLATLLASAWACFTAGLPEEALGWLRYVFAGYDYSHIATREENPDYYDLWTIIKTVEACAISQSGDYVKGIELSHAALKRLGGPESILIDRTNLWLWVTLWHNLGESYLLTGEPLEAYEALSTSRSDSIMARRPILYHFCSYEMGMVRFGYGNLRAAERLLKEAMRVDKTHMVASSTWALGLVYLGVAHIRLLEGRIEEARAHYNTGHVIVEESANVDGYLQCMMIRCMLDFAEGKASPAVTAIREAYKEASYACVPRGVGEDVLLMKLQVDVATGNNLSARQVMRECGERIAPEDLLHQAQFKAAKAFYLAMQKDAESAYELVDDAVNEMVRLNYLLYATMYQGLRAGILWDLNRKDEAAEAITEALISSFGMETVMLWFQYANYAPVRIVLEKFVHSSDASFAMRRRREGSLVPYAQQCLDAMGVRTSVVDESSEGANALTPKEIAVRDMIAAGKTRKEIADELGVSTNTVKTHVRSIYRKLGVHSNKELKQ